MHKAHEHVRFWLVLLVLAAIPIAVWHLDSGRPGNETKEHVYWLLAWLPYALLGALAFLGARLNQTRIAYVTITMGLAYALLRRSIADHHFPLSPDTVLHVSSMALPLACLAVLPMRESRLFSARGVLRALLCLLPWCALLGPALRSPDVMAYLLHAHTGLQPLWRLPIASLPIAAVAVVLILLLRNPSMRFFNRALAAGLAPVLFSISQAFAPPGLHPAPGVFLAVGFTSASAMLGYAVYRMYWEKAYVDDLTGLPNRRTLNERLAKLGRRYTVAMLDIDHFKRLNDTHGHAAGDHVLRFLAAHLQRAFGANAYRYGGEEFCVLFENVDKRMAAKMLDAFRRYIASREFVVRRADEVRKQTSQRDRGELEDGVLPRLRITLSAGLAYRDIPDEKPEDIIELADKTLYAAKQQGRNRVLYYGPLE